MSTVSTRVSKTLSLGSNPSTPARLTSYNINRYDKVHMKLHKVLRDKLTKIALGTTTVPAGLFEWTEYTIHFKGINFDVALDKNDKVYRAKSTNFRHGVIFAEAISLKELDNNIKDAILTAFEIPSSYRKEARITNENAARKESRRYAFA